MHKTKTIKTCLVGLGNVGQGRYLKSGSKNSHIHSILENKSFELVAAVDPNLGQEIDLNLSRKVFSAIKELAGADIDLVVIASPTHTHLEICRNVEEYLKPKVVLIEKPTGLTLSLIHI